MRSYLAGVILTLLLLLTHSARAGILSGYVSADDVGPIVDATVEVSQGGAVVATTVSLSDGYYEVTLDPGTYDIRVEPPGESGYLESTIPGILVTATSTRRDIVLTPLQFVLSWTIKRSNDAVIPGIQVYITGPGVSSPLWLDADPATGALPDLTVRPGDYSVQIRRLGITTRDDDNDPATPAESVTSTFNIYLRMSTRDPWKTPDTKRGGCRWGSRVYLRRSSNPVPGAATGGRALHSRWLARSELFRRWLQQSGRVTGAERGRDGDARVRRRAGPGRRGSGWRLGARGGRRGRSWRPVGRRCHRGAWFGWGGALADRVGGGAQPEAAQQRTVFGEGTVDEDADALIGSAGRRLALSVEVEQGAVPGGEAGLPERLGDGEALVAVCDVADDAEQIRRARVAR